MIERTIAKRYARALMAVALQHDRLERLRTDLAALRDVLVADPAALRMLVSPLVPQADRRRLLGRLLGVVQLGDDVVHFATLLLERGRIDLIGHVAEAFERLADHHLNTVRASLTSAVPLEDRTCEHVRSLLQKRLGKNVIVRNDVDASILGGVVLRVGNTVLDASVKKKLSQMKQAVI
jgi:F-type H+-transporting ATPase subunit delta